MVLHTSNDNIWTFCDFIYNVLFHLLEGNLLQTGDPRPSEINDDYHTHILRIYVYNSKSVTSCYIIDTITISVRIVKSMTLCENYHL